MAEAISRIRPRRLPEPELSWLELLRREFADERFRTRSGQRAAGYRVGGEIVAGARAATQDRFDPLRPIGDGGVWPYGELAGWLEVGPIVAVSRVRSDAYFPDDPDGEDVGRRLEARSEEAYVAAQFSAVSLYVGRIARNWGPVDRLRRLARKCPTVRA